jgi:hypothetical protein
MPAFAISAPRDGKIHPPLHAESEHPLLPTALRQPTCLLFLGNGSRHISKRVCSEGDKDEESTETLRSLDLLTPL